MASNPPQSPKLDRYVVIHVATTCDEHGVYVTKDSAEVIELGWLLLDTKTCEEVSYKEKKNFSVAGADESLLAAPREHSCQARQHPNHTALQYVGFF